MIKLMGLVAIGLVLTHSGLTSPAAADEFLGSYVARISWKDHEASTGRKLDTAAQVVRQDRANVHRHIQTDEEDDIDVWFTTNAKRGQFEKMLKTVIAIPSCRPVADRPVSTRCLSVTGSRFRAKRTIEEQPLGVSTPRYGTPLSSS